MMNKNLKKKVSVVAFSIIGGIAFSCGATTVMQEVSASNDVFENAQVQMISGASVRYYKGETDDATNEESGIRFSAVINSEVYNELEALENETVKVSYGMVIAPYEYVKNHEFNEATLFGVNGDKVYTWEGETVAEGTTYQKIAHVTYDTIIASKVEGYVGYHEIKGSILKIKPENLTKEFVGRGYVKYEYEEENGAKAVKYKFASYENDKVENNARSIAYVSQVAIEKGDAAADFVKKQYVSKVEAVDTTYTVETYVGETLVKSEVFEGVKVNEELTVEPADYNGFINVTDKTQKSGKVYANGKLVLKHVYEEDASYQVANGGFEDGLTGWTVTGDIGAVSNETHYWKNENGGYAFGLDGEKMFSCYAVSETDEKTGTLVSDSFTVGGSGWLTYKIGGMMRTPLTYVEIVDSVTGEIYKRYGNANFTADNQLGCTLNAYKANLSFLMGRTVYIRVCDYARSDYGVVFADSFDALHFAEPKDIAVAKEVGFTNNKYELYNGDFNNDLDGWYEKGEIGDISTDENGWWEDGNGKFKNNGNYFSAYKPTDVEINTGSLVSSVFEIGGSGWITYSIGAMRDPDKIYMEVIDALTGERYGYFYNVLMYQCELIKYKADLSDFIGKLVYINFVDKATTGYGLIFCDEIKTYYESEPVGEYNVAVNCVYNVMNGGFETGNLSGWTLVNGVVPGRVTDAKEYWKDPNHPLNKGGNWAFTGVDVNGLGPIENEVGVLRSNTFILKENSYISFKMAGGNRDDLYICVVRADTGEVLQEYHNTKCEANKEGTFNEYLNNAIGNQTEVLCYIEIVDDAGDEEGGWRLLGVDSIEVTQTMKA